MNGAWQLKPPTFARAMPIGVWQNSMPIKPMPCPKTSRGRHSEVGFGLNRHKLRRLQADPLQRVIPSAISVASPA